MHMVPRIHFVVISTFGNDQSLYLILSFNFCDQNPCKEELAICAISIFLSFESIRIKKNDLKFYHTIIHFISNFV